MAQQNATQDRSTDAENSPDPELAANTLEQAADSLQVLMTRDEMRSAAREWGTRSSGTKQEMAEDMLAAAEEQALGLLAEEGVALGGALTEDEAEGSEATEAEAGLAAPDEVGAEVLDEVAREYGMGAGAVKGALSIDAPAHPDEVESEADEAALEARRRAGEGGEDEASEAESEGEDEDSSSGRARTPVGEMLAQDPAEYHREDALGYSSTQVAVLAHAMQHPEDTDQQVAEAVECSTRYANSVCHRYDASDEGLEALREAGHEVPDCYTEVGN